MELKQSQSNPSAHNTASDGMLFLPSTQRNRQLRISERRLILMLGDTFAVVTAVMIALWVWSRVAGYDFTLEFVLPNSYLFLVMALLWLLLASANDFYDLGLTSDRTRSMQRLLSITAQLVVIYLLVFFVSPRDALPRLFIIYYGVASFALIALWRGISFSLLGWATQARRVLILGTGPTSTAIIRAIQEQHQHIYEIHGIISERDPARSPASSPATGMISGVPVLGSDRDLTQVIE